MSRTATTVILILSSLFCISCPDAIPVPAEQEYYVTFDGNGNTDGTIPVDPNTYISGATVTVLGNTGNLARTGYTFAGWNTSSSGTGTNRSPGSTFSMGSANLILYAKWTLSPTYSVSYSGNGSTSGTVPVDGNAYLSGATVTVLGNTGSLARTGYTFAGWNTSSSGTGTDRSPGSTFAMGSANLILYAKWTSNPTYSVSYSGNGSTSGTVPVDGNAYLSGATVTVRDNTGNLAKTGSTFDGWNTAANGSGTDYPSASTFTMGSTNVLLYAKWHPYAVGDTGPAGGIVFYDKGSYSDGWRYLESAPADLSYSQTWYNGTDIAANAYGASIGTGKTNTTSIVAIQGAGYYAAKLCDDYVSGGFSDWFLPSADELSSMIYFIATNYPSDLMRIRVYWSSTEYDNSYAREAYFSSGYVYLSYVMKKNSNSVRPIRAF